MDFAFHDRRRGKVLWFDPNERYGFIKPDDDDDNNNNDRNVFVHSTSLRLRLEKPLRAGDWVEYNVITRDFEPRMKAIDVVPISLFCMICGSFEHLWPTCPEIFLEGDFCYSRCYNCGEEGHITRVCCHRYKPEFDVCSDRKLKELMKMANSFRVKELVEVPMKVVKCKEDVKNVEEYEDCFILDFDPNYKPPLNFKDLSLCEKDDVFILAENGQVACRDFPHPRHLCAKYQFDKTPHNMHCKMCYCYLCEEPAPCSKWSQSLAHSGATDDERWKTLKAILHTESFLEGVSL